MILVENSPNYRELGNLQLQGQTPYHYFLVFIKIIKIYFCYIGGNPLLIRMEKPSTFMLTIIKADRQQGC
jgi:hypothetical protein